MSGILRVRMDIEDLRTFPFAGVERAYDEGPDYDYELADAATDDTTIGLGGLTTITDIVIISTQTVSVKYSGNSTAETLTANIPHVLLGVSQTTAPTVSNASGSTAKIKCWLRGT